MFKDENTPNALETMNTILGSNYQIVTNGLVDPVILAKLPDEDLAPKSSVDSVSSQPLHVNPSKPAEKTTDEYLFQFYLGSMTVVGLFILFRMIQKSK